MTALRSMRRRCWNLRAFVPLTVASKCLHGVDLRVPEGAVVALLGPNGAGKTTTINVCSGLMPPTRGSSRSPDGE